MQKIIIHIDMNSYFASVEQQANPLLRNKPVGVCAYLPKQGSNKGAIIASSKEAKKMGVKTGFPVFKARELCPNIILVENEPAKYKSTTQKIFNIFREYTEVVEGYSIDEAFLDVTGHVKDFKEAEELFLTIKKRIKNEVGDWLTCSGGISWTRWLAKFASDVTESNSYILLDTIEKKDSLLGKVAMIEAWGIGKGMDARLERLGITSLLELKDYPVANLMNGLGKSGYFLWANVNGLEVEKVRTQEERAPKSIGHSYCIPRQTNDLMYLSKVMMKLCERAGRRLRSHDLEGLRIYAGYYLVSGDKYFKSRKVSEPLRTTKDIYEQVLRILREQEIKSPVRLLALSIGSLRPYSAQMNLFEDKTHEKNLSDALDSINSKYGEFTVHTGSMWGMAEHAQERIGFRKTVDINEIEDDVRYEE